MAAKKSIKKEQTLEDKLWDTAEVLRGNVSPTSYKDIALDLLFLKIISASLIYFLGLRLGFFS